MARDPDKGDRKARGRTRLFRRVYLHGLVLSLALVFAVGAMGQFWGPGPEHSRRVEHVDRMLSGPRGAPMGRKAIQMRVARAHEDLQADIAVYDRQGKLIAAAGENPPPALPADEAAALDAPVNSREGHRVTRSVPLRTRGGVEIYVRVAWDSRPASLRFALLLLLVLGLSAILLFPLARAIARPLEQIATVTDAIGAGDLEARTGLDRSDEIGVLAKSVDAMAARIGRNIRAERELLANVSHELRTPLARLRVALELCEEAPESLQEVTTYLAGMRGDVAELEQLVEDVLTATRLALSTGEQPLLKVRRDAVDLGQVVAEAEGRFRERLGPGHSQIGGEASVPVLGDALLLRRLMDNLLDNAERHGSRGGLPLRVEITLRREGQWGVVEVVDNGPGVDPQDVAHLFTPFFRARQARLESGVGLGLALCRNIAEAHGGSIRAENALGGGLRLRVQVPLQTAPLG